jgi:AcrR family transcriptional regulator
MITEQMSSVIPTGDHGPRPAGRPREERVDRAIVAAALELMAESGISELRMDQVAERARVGKAAIYRRFHSKDEMVAAAVGALVSEITVPDTGSTRSDLLELMRGAVLVYTKSIAGKLMPSVVEAMRRDPELARVVREQVVAGRRVALEEVLDRGIARGDLRTDLDVELTLDVLGGPLFYRLLITGGPLDDRLAHGVVDLILESNKPKDSSR